ncbi:MAG: RimK family alpha-L-glutamate ligase, partial [Clostridiales bacterium]
MGNHKLVGILGTETASQTQELTAAFANKGAEVILIDPKRLVSSVPNGKVCATMKNSPSISMNDLDALLIRALPGGSLEQVIYRLDALHYLENAGLPIINSPSVMEKTVDKFLTTALLSEAGLPVPRTLVTERFNDAMEVVEAWGDVVVKPVFGSLGKGIVRVDDLDIAHRVFRSLEMGRYIYYLQEYLPHNNVDYRLFVIGGQIIGAMKRHGDSWKTNISIGAKAESFEPNAELAALAIKATQVLSGDYLGVDILLSEGKYYIIEV